MHGPPPYKPIPLSPLLAKIHHTKCVIATHYLYDIETIELELMDMAKSVIGWCLILFAKSFMDHLQLSNIRQHTHAATGAKLASIPGISSGKHLVKTRRIWLSMERSSVLSRYHQSKP
jgi:hypothetical protein